MRQLDNECDNKSCNRNFYIIHVLFLSLIRYVIYSLFAVMHYTKTSR